MDYVTCSITYGTAEIFQKQKKAIWVVLVVLANRSDCQPGRNWHSGGRYRLVRAAGRCAFPGDDALACIPGRAGRGTAAHRPLTTRQQRHAERQSTIPACRGVWPCERAHEPFLILPQTPREPGHSN